VGDDQRMLMKGKKKKKKNNKRKYKRKKRVLMMINKVEKLAERGGRDLLREVMVQIRDNLDCDISFSGSWGSDNQRKTRIQTSPNCLNLGRSEWDNILSWFVFGIRSSIFLLVRLGLNFIAILESQLLD